MTRSTGRRRAASLVAAAAGFALLAAGCSSGDSGDSGDTGTGGSTETETSADGGSG